LLDVGLVELFTSEYVLTRVMPTKDIFGNWTKHRMCGDYHPVNTWIRLDKYAMPPT
jgi:hypothetical protein